jgi:pimeloyl-ACP methyl ester carboxylesterase
MATKVPLALLSGLLCDRGIWEPQIAALAGFATIHVPDFSRLDTIEGMAREVLAQVPGEFAAAGHSMGGRVALEILRLAPERVSGVTLLSTGYTPRAPGEGQRRQVLLDLARSEGLDALVSHWIPPLLSDTNPRRDAVLRDFREIARRSSVTIFENHIRALLARPDASAVLPQIRCPTLVVCGRQDAQSALAAHEHMASVIHESRLVAIDDCGHLSPLEAPETVNSAMHSWLLEVELRIRRGRNGLSTARAGQPDEGLPPVRGGGRSWRG